MLGWVYWKKKFVPYQNMSFCAYPRYIADAVYFPAPQFFTFLLCWVNRGRAKYLLLRHQSWSKKFLNITLPDCKKYGIPRFRRLHTRLSKKYRLWIIPIFQGSLTLTDLTIVDCRPFCEDVFAKRTSELSPNTYSTVSQIIWVSENAQDSSRMLCNFRCFNSLTFYY